MFKEDKWYHIFINEPNSDGRRNAVVQESSKYQSQFVK